LPKVKNKKEKRANIYSPKGHPLKAIPGKKGAAILRHYKEATIQTYGKQLEISALGTQTAYYSYQTR
jgi:hypothetical protein